MAPGIVPADDRPCLDNPETPSRARRSCNPAPSLASPAQPLYDLPRSSWQLSQLPSSIYLVTNQPSGGPTRKQIADLARQWSTRAVLGIVRESGGQVVDRPAFSDRPDLLLKITGTNAMAGLQAAVALKHAARKLSLDYVRYAREDGHPWQDIGIALGFSDDPEAGISAAVAAYDYATGTTPTWRSFAWVCLQCRATIIDHGPEAGHPADCEQGHADDCTRLAAAVAAWDASRDDEADQ
jgi:hypothetical protein